VRLAAAESRRLDFARKQGTILRPILIVPETMNSGQHVDVVAVERPSASWDTFVREDPNGTHAHLDGWHDLVRDVMRHEPLYMEARTRDGPLQGVLPLFELRSTLFPRRLVSMPLLSDGGPIGSAVACRALVAAALDRARDGRGHALELRSRVVHWDEPASTPRKVTVLLRLPEDPDDLWTSLKAKVRSQVRRPMKEGMKARFGAGELNAFYSVLGRNMRDMGTPVLPRRLFERIADAFDEDAVFGAVYHQGAPVAAGAGFVFRDEFELVWASALREHSRNAPNMLLYWAFMERMTRRGLRTFNFGRCTPGSGTHRFKLQWGGTDLQLPWITWSASIDAADAEPGRLARAASAVWKRLPVAVANRAGPMVARQLPWW
jgi:serine/alanine adding enzyme